MLLSIDLPVTDAAIRGDSSRTEPPRGPAGQSFTGVLSGFTGTETKTCAAPGSEPGAEPAGSGLPLPGKALPSDADSVESGLPPAVAGIELLPDAIAQAGDIETGPSTLDADPAETPTVVGDLRVPDQSLAEIAALSIRRLLGAGAAPGLPAHPAAAGAPAAPPIEGMEPASRARPGLPEAIGKALAAETGQTPVSATEAPAAVAAIAPEAVDAKAAERALERGIAARPALTTLVPPAPPSTPPGHDGFVSRGSSLELIPPSLVPPSIVPVERSLDAKGSRASEALTEAVIGRLFGGAQNAATPSGPLLAHFATAPATPGAPAAPAVPGIPVPLRDPAFGQMLGDRVLFMTGKGIPTAEIRMVPADLGPVTVNVVVDDGRAEVTFAAHHPHTREAIEQAMPRLREMLGDQGLTLGHASVTDSGAHRDRREDVPDDPRGGGLGGAGPAGPSGDSPVERLERAIKGLVDTFA